MSEKEIKAEKKKQSFWASLGTIGLAIVGIVVGIATQGKIKGK